MKLCCEPRLLYGVEGDRNANLCYIVHGTLSTSFASPPQPLGCAFRMSMSCPGKLQAWFMRPGIAGIRRCGTTGSPILCQQMAPCCCKGPPEAGWQQMWCLHQLRPSCTIKLRHCSCRCLYVTWQGTPRMCLLLVVVTHGP